MVATVEQTGVESEIRLEGAVTIAIAADLKQLLVEALAKRENLRVHVDQVSDLDVCGLQLIVAANRAWRQAGLAFTIAGTLPEQLREGLLGAGFDTAVAMVSQTSATGERP